MTHSNVQGVRAFLREAFLLILLTLMGAAGSKAFAQQAAEPAQSTPTVRAASRMMSCDVVYGGNAQCSGAGICKITQRTTGGPTAMEKKLGCKSTTGLLFPIDEGNGVSLILTKQMLCPQFYNSHLQKGILLQENNAELSEEIIQTLGLKINKLNAGSYPVKEEAGQLTIDFKSSKN
ncbi:MAG: hypothetical protein IT261_12090 [Saprospiraceae bacterium]|nr:hypothetical protein [Saprospiraceae bacterium]